MLFRYYTWQELLRAHMRFPLQSGQGLGPKYLFGPFPALVTRLPSYGLISPTTMSADLPIALGMAAEPLGEAPDLV